MILVVFICVKIGNTNAIICSFKKDKKRLLIFILKIRRRLLSVVIEG